jgi:hypothetical protein
MGHVLPFQQFERSLGTNTRPADSSNPLWALQTAPLGLGPYSIKGVSRGPKIEVFEKIFVLDFI